MDHEQLKNNEQEPIFGVGIPPEQFDELLEKGEITSESDLLPKNSPTNVGEYVLVRSMEGGGPAKKCLIMSISLTEDEQKTLTRYRLKENK